jgi:hypothetical protein
MDDDFDPREAALKEDARIASRTQGVPGQGPMWIFPLAFLAAVGVGAAFGTVAGALAAVIVLFGASALRSARNRGATE